MIFSIFRFFASSDSRFTNIVWSYCPNKPYINGNIIYSASRWCINLNFTKWTLTTGFVVQGHVCFLSSYSSTERLCITHTSLITWISFRQPDLVNTRQETCWHPAFVLRELNTTKNIMGKIWCGFESDYSHMRPWFWECILWRRFCELWLSQVCCCI